MGFKENCHSLSNKCRKHIDQRISLQKCAPYSVLRRAMLGLYSVQCAYVYEQQIGNRDKIFILRRKLLNSTDWKIDVLTEQMFTYQQG